MALYRRLLSTATSASPRVLVSSASVHSASKTPASKSTDSVEEKLKKLRHIPEFPLIYPDFLQTSVWGRRNALRERLERADMLERRMQLDIPEFYVGSIVAVTTSDPNLASRQNRFLGICIRREREGLHHQFTLRNVVDGLGVEVMYELYNPTIIKIETVKLERRLDNDLSYLIDALPEYSTFDFNLEPIAHPAGTPIPVNNMKVKLRPPPWTSRWELYDYKGIEDSWTQATPYYKRKFHQTKVNDFRKYDLIADYRERSNEIEHELAVEKEMARFEAERHHLLLQIRWPEVTQPDVITPHSLPFETFIPVTTESDLQDEIESDCTRGPSKITQPLNLSDRSLRKRALSSSVPTMETVGDICRMVLESRSGLGAGSPVAIPESIVQQAEHVLFHELPVSVHTILAHEKCREERRAECPNAIQVEVWTIRVDKVREENKKLLEPLFLKQAVRSHLHFSQLNSWISNNNNKLPPGMICSYRLSLSDHLKNEELLTVGSHCFPQCLLDRHHLLTVSVKWVKRDQGIPALPPKCVFEKVPFEEWEQPLSPNDTSPPNTPFFFISPDDDKCCGDRESANPPPTKRVHRASLATSESSDNTLDGVSSFSSPERECVPGRGTPEGVISQSSEVEVLADFLASSSTIGAARIAHSSTYDSAMGATPRRPRTLNLRQRRNTTGSVERNASDPSLMPRAHGNPLEQPFAFNRRTGLPLNSSPAPLKRNERSFAADLRLERLRRGSQFVDDSSGSDGEGTPCVAHLARSPTSGNGLLCNFEESVLNGRLEPLASIAGFRLELAANGSFASPHLHLPVTTFFFNITDDAAPSPYLGHCSLEEIGRKGYHISKRGTVQATLFNPQGTVVKIFVVKVDLADMPPSSQTFIRQRSFFMPVGCRLEKVQRSWLKYLVHLRLATDRAGRLFIHTDIRVLFSNKSDLDSLNLESDRGAAQPKNSEKFELTTFTEMPQRPKYSPVK